MTTVLDILGNSTPVSDVLANKIGFIRAGIACRIFFYQQLKQRVCSASIATLAKKLGMSTGAVSTNIKWLRDNEYIEVVGEHKSGNVTNKYIVTKKFYDALEHSECESEHSECESNIQNVNGKEETKEEGEEKTTSGSEIDHNYSTVTKAYENEIGLLSSVIKDSIADCVDTYPVDWITEAITISAKQNKRRWSYVEGILKRWKVEGKKTMSKNGKEVKKERREEDKIYNVVTGEWSGGYYDTPSN